MTSETREGWRVVRLGDHCSKIGSGATPRGGEETYTTEGAALIRSQNVHDFTFSWTGLARITETAAAQLKGVTVQPGDVLLNITGQSVTRCCRAPDAVVPARVNQHVAIVRGNNSTLANTFLHYLVAAQKPRLLTLASAGATREALTKSMIAELRVPLPPIAEQRQIALVLGSLDAKIDRNRKLAHVLEEVAGVLYQSRCIQFVDQDEPVESASGLIPQGSSGVRLGDIAELSRDSVNPKEEPIEIFEHFSFAAFDSGGSPEYTPGADLKSAKLRVDRDCVLVSKLNPETQRVWWPIPSGRGTPVCSPEFVALRPRDGIPHAFLYAAALFDQRLRDHIVTHASGTTGSRQRVRPSEVLAAILSVPSAGALDELARPLASLFERAEAARREMRTLASIRDTLLPRLVSGQLQVAEGRELSAEAA